jgi:hypothetical protein
VENVSRQAARLSRSGTPDGFAETRNLGGGTAPSSISRSLRVAKVIMCDVSKMALLSHIPAIVDRAPLLDHATELSGAE